MFLKLDAKSLERFSEGIVFLDRNAQITDFNRAAKPWLKLCFGEAEKIRDVVTKTMREKKDTSFPVYLQPDSDESFPPCSILLTRGLKDGFALIFTPTPSGTPVHANDLHANHIADLMGDEMRHELADLLLELGGVTQEISAGDLVSLREHAAHLRNMFIALEEMAHISKSGSMFPGERFNVVDLMRDAVGLLSQRHCDYSIDVKTTDTCDSVGSVYGNAKWTRSAFLALLECIEDGAPQRSQIAIAVWQSGSFVSVTGRFSNIASKCIKDAKAHESTNDSSMHLVTSNRIPFARRIVELHGGHLAVHGNEGDEATHTSTIDSFTLHLPTGCPSNQRNKECETCAVNQQAAAFARDFALLMPERSLEAVISEEEYEALMSVR